MISNIKKRNPGFSHFDLKSPLYLGVARILRWCRWCQVRWQRLERGNFVSLAKATAVMPYVHLRLPKHINFSKTTAVLPSLSDIAKTYQLLSYLSLYKRCCGENWWGRSHRGRKFLKSSRMECYNFLFINILCRLHNVASLQKSSARWSDVPTCGDVGGVAIGKSPFSFLRKTKHTFE